MKWLILLLTAALLGPGVAGEQTVTLAVENMTCALCPITVAAAIGGVSGVSSVDVDDEADIAVVTFDDTLGSIDQIVAASTDAGYPARPVE
jgi:periplasmic mercuric ion binding protein